MLRRECRSALSWARRAGALDATFLDFDRDGHLDLFVATYVDLGHGKLPKPGENPYCNFKGVPVNCGPRGLAMGKNYLYRNQGDGTFRRSD